MKESRIFWKEEPGDETERENLPIMSMTGEL